MEYSLTMGKYYQIFNLSKTSNNMRITICHYYCGLSSQKYTAGKDFNEHLLKHKKLQFNPTDSETAIIDRFAIPTLHCILDWIGANGLTWLLTWSQTSMEIDYCNVLLTLIHQTYNKNVWKSDRRWEPENFENLKTWQLKNLKTLKTLKIILGTCWTTFVFMSRLKSHYL